jgi:selenocysteine lyase/cysteine desulfurase
VLAVSQVSFYTGQNLDIANLADGLRSRSHACLLAIDSTHASGVVEVPAALTDLCVSSSYKWLLATHGTAPCYVSERASGMVADG